MMLDRGNRVVIDRRAFNDRDGYTVDPYVSWLISYHLTARAVY